jgi:microsomal dipeptidase-like Zn-dependent dipeptidase
MIVDLHSHYPMHLAADDPATLELMLSTRRESLRDRLRARLLRVACRLANYQGPGGGPAVTLTTLAASRLRVALSSLFVPLDELDLEVRYGAAPRADYFAHLLAQIRTVEESVARQREVVVAHDSAELDDALAAGRVALIHAVEGGFHLGDTPEAVRANVGALADRGVAYITVAHLFWRQIATNAPAVPFLPDWIYRLLFPQPRIGLTELGRTMVAAMFEHRILVDVTHMSTRSFDDTMALLDQLDPGLSAPVIAGHTAYRFTGHEYDLSEQQVRQIARRRGVIGLILCPHWIDPATRARSFQESVQALCRHIDRLQAITGSHEFTAIGSDQDGFIKPALPGLETPIGMGALEEELARRYGRGTTSLICSENARRVLAWWGSRAAAAEPAAPTDWDAHM